MYRQWGMAGDPGFFGSIGKLIGGVARTVLGIPKAPSFPGMGQLPGVIGRGVGKIAKRIPRAAVIGAGVGAAAGVIGGRLVDEFGNPIARRRRMQVTNQKALRRSMRRVQGFAKLARRTITFTRTVKMKKRGRR